MNINIRNFLFNQLNKIEESKSINELVFENYIPIELEKRSLSFQHGKLLIGNDGKLLVFESKLFDEQVPILIEHELDELLPNEIIPGLLLDENQISSPTYSRSMYTGGGTLTNHHGIDFQFSCPLYEGVFLLEEKTGFSKNIKIKRVS